jgi:cell division protein ZapA
MSSLDITLLGKEYRVACKEEEREGLLSAVAFLDQRMAEIAGKTRAASERVAVMAALNLAHELLTLRSGGGPVVDADNVRRRINSIEARVDQFLAEQPDLF